MTIVVIDIHFTWTRHVSCLELIPLRWANLFAGWQCPSNWIKYNWLHTHRQTDKVTCSKNFPEAFMRFTFVILICSFSKTSIRFIHKNPQCCEFLVLSHAGLGIAQCLFPLQWPCMSKLIPEANMVCTNRSVYLQSNLSQRPFIYCFQKVPELSC